MMSRVFIALAVAGLVAGTSMSAAAAVTRAPAAPRSQVTSTVPGVGTVRMGWVSDAALARNPALYGQLGIPTPAKRAASHRPGAARRSATPRPRDELRRSRMRQGVRHGLADYRNLYHCLRQCRLHQSALCDREGHRLCHRPGDPHRNRERGLCNRHRERHLLLHIQQQRPRQDALHLPEHLHPRRLLGLPLRRPHVARFTPSKRAMPAPDADDRWRLDDAQGREIAVMPEDWGQDGLGHAVIWGLRARDAAHLTEAVLVNEARASRRKRRGSHLPPEPYPDQNQACTSRYRRPRNIKSGSPPDTVRLIRRPARRNDHGAFVVGGRAHRYPPPPKQ